MPEQQPIRIGNREREDAVHSLGEHFAHGRLNTDEFEDRVARAYGARTADELRGLFHDLPSDTSPVPVPHYPPAPYPTAEYPAAPYLTSQYPAAQVPGPQYVGPGHPVPWVAQPAPYGWEPHSGRPYSDRSKVIAGVLQLVLPLGVGRFYTGHTGLGVAQLLLSFFGVGVLWCWIDGIVLLAGRPTDPYGRPLRS